MLATPTHNTIARSKTRRRRRVSWWVLVWMCLSQFPIPIAHAHHAAADHDVQLAAHIASKHSTGTDQTDRLHWHLLMPWELGGEQGDDDRDHHPSPLGLWGTQGDSLPQSETSVERSVPLLERAVCVRINFQLLARGSRFNTTVPPPANFMQTYFGVPLRLLVCVCLR